MAPLTELAAAKINLTLEILGRRPDGYHELVSLVAFARAGDRLSLTPGEAFGLDVEGPFGADLGADNLVERAVRRAQDYHPALRAGAFRLEKMLPMAAGLGGGSADAAAALRLLAAANPEGAGAVDFRPISAELGADVTVCLEQRAALMWGIGERVAPVARLPETFVVLVNPGVPLATAEVYAALDAPPLDGEMVDAAPGLPGPFPDLDALLAFLQSSRNDLEAPALRLAPEITEARDLLAEAEGCRLVRLSGSGATWFGVFATQAEAERAAERIARDRPGWWVVASSLR
ncbi:MAG: 4-(cytidine 5'-diphospho)-2-C-methyl-D-erythritol kinase [Methyloligellaceae bacterium]